MKSTIGIAKTPFASRGLPFCQTTQAAAHPLTQPISRCQSNMRPAWRLYTFKKLRSVLPIMHRSLEAQLESSCTYNHIPFTAAPNLPLHLSHRPPPDHQFPSVSKKDHNGNFYSRDDS
jgi:hypothetical protein